MSNHKRTLPLRLSAAQKTILTQLADEQRLSMNGVVLAALEAYVGSDWPSTADGRARATTPALPRSQLPPEDLQRLRRQDAARQTWRRAKRAAARNATRQAFSASHIDDGNPAAR